MLEVDIPIIYQGASHGRISVNYIICYYCSDCVSLLAKLGFFGPVRSGRSLSFQLCFFCILLCISSAPSGWDVPQIYHAAFQPCPVPLVLHVQPCSPAGPRGRAPCLLPTDIHICMPFCLHETVKFCIWFVSEVLSLLSGASQIISLYILSL